MAYRNLETAIKRLYGDAFSVRHSLRNNRPVITPIRYMEIPIGADAFELPLLAFNGFRNMLDRDITADLLVAQLCSYGAQSDYKSLDAIMRDSLDIGLSSHLRKVELKDSDHPYFVTYGAVFNWQLEPIAMMSWEMEHRVNDENGHVHYYYKRPLFRVNPSVFVEHSDSMQRYICGKMTQKVLGVQVYPQSYTNSNASISNVAPGPFKPKVEIDGSPFVIRGIDTPSISTTNENLLQLAIDHIEEVTQ